MCVNIEDIYILLHTVPGIHYTSYKYTLYSMQISTTHKRTYARHQQVEGVHGLAVRVVAHIKGLRIIHI